MTITAKTFLGRGLSGELTQPNGRWVLFDPDRVADKILDPELVPLIEQRVQQIRDIDRAFMRSEPNSFIDEEGRKWMLAPSI